MANYTYAQLEQIWRLAGGNPIFAPIAAAVAMAESSGDPLSFNPKDPNGGSKGLWQINGIHGAQSSFDVMTNARAAVAISNNGTNWTQWGSFTNGSYRQFLNPNTPPDPNVSINGTAQTVADVFGSSSNPGGTGAQPLACSSLEKILDPFACNPAVSGGSNPVTKFLSGIIQGMIAAIVNPILSIIAGSLGIMGGSILMIAGLMMMLKESEIGREASRGAATAIKVAA